MNSSERFIRALEKDIPDRVPIFVQMFMPKFEQNLLKSLQVPLQSKSKFILFNQNFKYMHQLGIDASWGYVDLWKAGKTQEKKLELENLLFQTNQKDQRLKSMYYIDFEGRIWRKLEQSQMEFEWYGGNYIKTLPQAEDWVDSYLSFLPDINYNALFKLDQQIRKFPKDEFTPIFMIEKIFEPIWQGFGLSLLAQLARKKSQFLRKVITYRKKLVEYQLDHLLELDFDVFCMEDASAFRKGSIISPDFHTNYIAPVYSAVVNKIHKAGKHIFFHSDGDFTELIPNLINADFEGVGGLEVDAGMDLSQLKPKFGESVAFIGNFKTDILSSATPLPELKKNVVSTLSYGMPDGGYIFAPDTDLFSHCSVENLRAMITIIKKYGKYK